MIRRMVSGTLCLVFVVISIFILLASSNSHADTTTSATASVTVASACTMSQDSSTFVPHAATIPAGTYRDEIGLTTFNVVCNDASGYSIYAVGYSNNEFGNTTLLYEDRTMTGIDIITGTNTSGSTSNWAMKLKTTTGNTPAIQSDTNGSFSSYHIVPSTYTKVATLTPITTTNQNSSFQATYAAYAAGTQTAGTYNGKVKYTLVHPANEAPLQPQDCASNKICYWPNAIGVTDSMGDQTIYNNTDTSATLWNPNFKRLGYGFAGWSDKYDWIVNANDKKGIGTGANEGYHIYGPNQDITFAAGQYSGTNKGLSLYAVWVKSQGVIQNWNGCNSMTIGQVTALTDIRDNNTYAVAKLSDEKCWMMENLRLGGTTAMILTSDTTNIAAGTTFTLSGSQDPTLSAWCINIHPTCYDKSMLFSNNTTDPAANMVSVQNQYVYSYGNYYNWFSATAGSGIYNESSGNMEYDICPAGWFLPSGNVSGDYAVLASSANVVNGGLASATFRAFPINYLYSGSVYESSLGYRGTEGAYWASTASSNDYAFGLFFKKYEFRAAFANRKHFGFAARCVSGS